MGTSKNSKKLTTKNTKKNTQSSQSIDFLFFVLFVKKTFAYFVVKKTIIRGALIIIFFVFL